MSVQTELDSRTVRLREILVDANTALAEKGGAAANALSGLPTAIQNLPSNVKLQYKSVTPTGERITVEPDVDYDGLSAVDVEGDENLTPENIAKDITIYGVTGTHEGDPELQYKMVTPTGEYFTIEPDEGYDGLSAVDIEGDQNLVPENIANGVTIYGVTGTHEGGGGGGIELPAEYQQYLDAAKGYYTGEYEHFFISENDEYVTVGFLTPDFTITEYDAANGDFGAYGWYSYKYTKADDTWEITDYTYRESPGYNYSRNIKYADFYIEYNGMTLFPVGMGAYPDTVAIDYSDFDNGSFTETIETGDTLTYSVEFNADGEPNKITAPDGTVTWIEWGES